METTSKRLGRVLAHNLKMERAEKLLSQAFVAEKAQISIRQYHKIESGQANPTLHTIIRLATAFGVNADELMKIKKLRTRLSPEEYLREYQSKFRHEPLPAGLRTLEGLVLWGNPASEKVAVHFRYENKPMDLLKVMKGSPKEILKVQLSSEKRGMVAPYINYVLDPLTRQRHFIRYYPVLVFPKVGTNPHFAAIFMTPVESDSPMTYYRFCDRLLNID